MDIIPAALAFTAIYSLSMPNEPKLDPSEAKQRRLDAARNAFALKMAALHDLSLELSMAEDVDDLCRRAVGLGHRVLGFDRIGLWFVDPADPALLYGSFGTDESGGIRDERGIRWRRSDEALPEGFYEGKDPVYYMGEGPCFNERHEVIGSAEKALALIWDGRTVIGEICVDNLLTKRSIDGGSLELLVRFARIVGYLTSLKRVQAELKILSSTDALTGVVNRRTVLLILEKQLSLAARKSENLAVISCCLEGLKEIIDAKGRDAGDEYVKMVSSALTRSVRDSDTVGRMGAEEFLVVLPDCETVGAAVIDGRIEATLALTSGVGTPLRLRRGIATFGELAAPKSGRGYKALVELAEARMFEAR
jgi:diguanylate cyclase (GGDEF)-like protein